MTTELYWIDGPWKGRLALASRPRGGDWLEGEMDGWRRAGIDTVVSLLTPEESEHFELEKEAQYSRAKAMAFVPFPIVDRDVPKSETDARNLIENLSSDLTSGKNVVIHCRQGIGRTGIIAACLLVSKGFNPDAAVARLSAVRGTSVPETREQRQWIDHYAMTLLAQ